jgi:hypothetical protein
MEKAVLRQQNQRQQACEKSWALGLISACPFRIDGYG